MKLIELTESAKPLITAAKNIRIELKNAFPKTKFSVRSESFSMGNAIRISWDNGPCDNDVEKIGEKYVGSKFNSMEDYSEYVSTAHTKKYGDAKFVTYSREISEGLKESVQAALRSFDGDQSEDFLLDQRASGDAWQMLRNTSIPPNAEFKSIGNREEITCWTYCYDKYFINWKETTPPPVKKSEDLKHSSFTFGTVVHAKKRVELFVAQFSNRVEREDFVAARDIAKECDGYYSSYSMNGAMPGFQFESEVKRSDFINRIVCDSLPVLEKATEEEDSSVPQKDLKTAARLQSSADSMEDLIDSKINNATADQNPTPRRARIAAGMEADGRQLQKVQRLLRITADKLIEGKCPPELREITSRAAASRALSTNHYCKVLLLDDVETPEAKNKRKIKELERSLIGSKISGFFETPKHVVYDMIDHAQLFEGARILEPNGGAGSILEALREKGFEADTLEINYTLRELLKKKEFNVVSNDFDTFDCVNGSRYDRILMNPPFENGKDCDHVRKAWDCLKEDGILVAVVCEGVFFRQTQKETSFREWINYKMIHEYKLPSGTFEKGRITSTGTAARIIILEK